MQGGGCGWRGIAFALAGALVIGGCGSSGNGGQGGGGAPGSGGKGGGAGARAGGGAGTGGAAGGGAAGGGVAGGGGSSTAGNAGSGGGVSTGGGGVAGGGGTGGGAGPGVAGAGGAAVGGTAGSAVGGAAGGGCAFTATAGVWSEIAARAADAGMTVTDSFALGADDVLFAGVTAAGAAANQLRVVRFTSGCWSEEFSTPIDASARSASVHATGPSDLWAVGGDVIMHGTDQAWTSFDSSWMTKVQLTPRIFNAPTVATLVRVRAVSATDVWFNEWENVLHWANGTWTGYNFDSGDYPNASAAIAFQFHDIWIDAADSVWVSYGSDQVGNTMDPAGIRQFDGANWTTFDTGVYDMYDIWRSGGTLWLAGGFQFTGTLIPFVATASTFPEPVAILGVGMSDVGMSSLWGRAGNDIWAAGTDVARFDGTNWTLQTDVPAATHSTTQDWTNTFVGGDPAATWLVTPGPHFFRRPAP